MRARAMSNTRYFLPNFLTAEEKAATGAEVDNIMNAVPYTDKALVFRDLCDTWNSERCPLSAAEIIRHARAVAAPYLEAHALICEQTDAELRRIKQRQTRAEMLELMKVLVEANKIPLWDAPNLLRPR